MSDTLPVTNSYLDFNGLGRLKGQARNNEDKALRETAQQFEAMFIQMMMKTMRDSIPKSGLIESNALDTFTSMQDKEISMQLARRGSFGIANMMVAQFERNKQQTPAAEALAARTAQGDSALQLNTAGRDGLPLKPAAPAGLPMQKPLPSFQVPRPPTEGFPLQQGFGLRHSDLQSE